ncbi:MAG: aminoglycoside 6-adenylyltransferase [bacterium]|nr:aminoglycoside 6-adenylyltransferase [bacterium]
MTLTGFDLIIQRITEWATARDDVRAAIILGSRARQQSPADEWSDLDVWLIVNDPALYVAEPGWIETFGKPWLTFLEQTNVEGVYERRVLYEGGFDVDFIPLPAAFIEGLIHSKTLPDSTAMTIRRGVRFLVDKDDLQAKLLSLPLTTTPSKPPSQQEFTNVVGDFWYHAVWTAKKVRRGELWTAIDCLSSYMTWHALIPMIYWHTLAVRGAAYETWHKGRFLEQWADPRILEGMKQSFARYDADDIARAIWGMCDLFAWLAPETAERLGYGYDAESQRRITAYLVTLLPRP